jgi:hypothetical protein
MRHSRDADSARVMHELAPSNRRARATLKRGHRECRALAAPAASRAVKKAHELVTTGSPKHPAFPARWFYGLLRALPGDRALLSPSSAQCESIVANLNASVGASEPHGFAVRKQARFVNRTAASIASRPNVRDDGQRPSSRGRTTALYYCVYQNAKRIISSVGAGQQSGRSACRANQLR